MHPNSCRRVPGSYDTVAREDIRYAKQVISCLMLFDAFSCHGEERDGISRTSIFNIPSLSVLQLLAYGKYHMVRYSSSTLPDDSGLFGVDNLG
jgi:hypothetical protein